jgi:hypothetical protein
MADARHRRPQYKPTLCANMPAGSCDGTEAVPAPGPVPQPPPTPVSFFT